MKIVAIETHLIRVPCDIGAAPTAFLGVGWSSLDTLLVRASSPTRGSMAGAKALVTPAARRRASSSIHSSLRPCSARTRATFAA